MRLLVSDNPFEVGVARYPRTLLAYVTAVAVIGSGVLAYCLWRFPLSRGDLMTWALFGGFTILMALSDRYGLQFRRGTRVHVDTIPLFAGILLFDPTLALLIGGLGRLLGRVRRNANPVERVFNVGQTVIYTGAAALLLRVLAPETPWMPVSWSAWLGLLAAAVAMFMLNSWMVAGVVAIQTRAPVGPIWLAATPQMLLEYGVMYGYGLMTALVVGTHVWGLILVAVPSVVVFLTLDRTLRMEARQKQLADENAALADDLSQQAGQLREAYAVLEDALDAKNQMMQNVSHELRTPLVSILGFSEALQDGMYGELSAAQLTGLEAIVRNARGMNRQVDDLLSLQALDRRQLHLGEVDLHELLGAAVATFVQRAIAARIHLTVTCDEDVPALRADVAQLEQAFMHLLDNAIKFSPNGGDVTVRATRLNDTTVQIAVSDQGIGIPAEALPLIYRRFYQVDGSRTRRFGGQGLGLAIVKRIVEMHGGAVRAESQVGVGTTFYVTLPLSVAVSEKPVVNLD
jgi:signal transduction histidine kinase